MKKIYKKLIIITILFLALLSNESKAQCTISVNSTNGYTVNITTSIIAILPHSTVCPSGTGYVYNYRLSYVITFSGTNIPPNLYTLQGTVVDGSGTSFFDLPNNTATGTVVSANLSTSATNCATVTSSYFNPCIRIQIEGPSLSNRTINLACPCNIATPINLLEFKGKSENGGVVLDWSTVFELNNSYFLIERSSDLIDWNVIAKINGRGTSYGISYYNYFDSNTYNINYYRIKQVDVNGDFTYTYIIAVDNVLKNIKTVVYPNPVYENTFHIIIQSSSLTPIKIFVYDALGKVISECLSSKNEIELKMSCALPNFIDQDFYFIKIMQDGIIVGEHKLIINK